MADPVFVKGPHTKRVREFQEKMEEAMQGLQGWVYPIEIEVAAQPVYHCWALLHSEILRLYYEAKAIDERERDATS